MPCCPDRTDTCDDCRDLLAQHADEPGLTQLPAAAQHIAIGILYGGSPCDHVDYDDHDLAEAYRWHADRLARQRDIASAALMAVRRNDRSQPYEYGEPRPSDGQAPARGERWQTPRERAEAALIALHGHIPNV